MAFEFKVRGISKHQQVKIYRKYRKAFGKRNNVGVAVKSLLFDLIYEFFDNNREKLFKLLFPVVMAHFSERGSINSVIQEHRHSKGLYSQSYTYRMLNKLDDEIGLEISRVFRKILFKLVKNFGFENKGLCVAVDITCRPFYGNKNLIAVKGCKKKAGTNYAFQYLTASIVEEGARFNLLCLPIHSLTSVACAFGNMIREIRKYAKVKLVFLDRAFGNKKYSTVLKLLRHKFVMPITRNRKLKELELCVKEQCQPTKQQYWVVETDYVFSEDKAKEYHLRVKLIIVYEKGNVYFFITNIFGCSLDEYYCLAEAYGFRFGIETNYRMDNIFLPLTTSNKSCRRYLLMQFSLIVQDLWALLNFFLHKKSRKQPREKFKKRYSLIDIVKARIKDIGFTWRPLITAIQFKRKADRLLG